MRSSRLISTTEVHTEGLGVRVVTGGVATVPGSTMAQARLWFMQRADVLRRLLLNEPRGHSALSGALLQPARDPRADIGVLFIEVTGVLPMCGGATMAVATALVENGLVPVVEPTTRITLDTPVGLIEVDVQVEDSRAVSTTMTNVASFVGRTAQEVDVASAGRVECDLAYGGNWYAFVEAERLGLDLDRDPPERFVGLGREIMAAVNEQARPVHPDRGEQDCEHVVFLAPGAGAGSARHALVNHPGWLDRCPGGTGTSALMALLHARGRLGIGEEFVNESFIGTRFTARLLHETEVGGIPAVVPSVTGRSWVTGYAQWLLDPTDPFPEGFRL